MKKLVKGFLIAAVIMIIVGIALCVGGAVTGGISAARSVVQEIVDEEEFDIEIRKHFVSGDEYTRFSKDDVENIVIDIKAAEVVISEKMSLEEIGVHTEGAEFAIELKDKTLYITSDSKLNSNKVQLEFPVDFEFQKVNISAGASSISIQALNTKIFRAEIGAGAIEIDEFIAADAEFEIGAGEILVYAAEVKECSVDVGMGNFKYEGILSGDCDVDCGMGNAEFYLEGSEEDYNYKIDCAAGNVTVDNESFSGIGAEKVLDNDADANMDIDCSMGNVTIEF